MSVTGGKGIMPRTGVHRLNRCGRIRAHWQKKGTVRGGLDVSASGRGEEF